MRRRRESDGNMGRKGVRREEKEEKRRRKRENREGREGEREGVKDAREKEKGKGDMLPLSPFIRKKRAFYGI